MIKKTITYTNYNDEEVTEDFYFNLSKLELAEMEYGSSQSLTDRINAIQKENDQEKLFAMFKDLLLKAYGEKSSDGKSFVKSYTDANGNVVKLSDEFQHTAAFSELFMAIGTDADQASEFTKGIIPKDLNKSTELTAV